MGRKVILLLSFICFSCYSPEKHNIVGQISDKEDTNQIVKNNTEEDNICFDSIFKAINGVDKFCNPLSNADVYKYIYIKNGRYNYEYNEKYRNVFLNNDKVRQWLYDVKEDYLSFYSINVNSKEYLIMSSQYIGATGLASSIYNWIVVDMDNDKVICDRIKSLSYNYRSFFAKENSLHFIGFDFGDNFFENKDYESPDIKVYEYEMKNDTFIQLYSFNYKCW
ncbi:MAG: hypothetical protein H6Q15_1365 [Bacteroidetes bacterium]|nr:hypothetical protein [Bacteroidota bacterium]